MKRVRGGFGIVGLFVFLLVIIAFLPSIRSMFAPSFPEGFRAANGAAMKSKEGFRNVDCKGVLCNEGEFCQDNICRPVAAPITNNYFSGR
jgi:hypothetical protein